jgi:hypothetical protein
LFLSCHSNAASGLLTYFCRSAELGVAIKLTLARAQIARAILNLLRKSMVISFLRNAALTSKELILSGLTPDRSIKRTVPTVPIVPALPIVEDQSEFERGGFGVLAQPAPTVADFILRTHPISTKEPSLSKVGPFFFRTPRWRYRTLGFKANPAPFLLSYGAQKGVGPRRSIFVSRSLLTIAIGSDYLSSQTWFTPPPHQR